MKQLFDMAVLSKKKEFYQVLSGHHNDCFETPGYYKVISVIDGSVILFEVTFLNSRRDSWTICLILVFMKHFPRVL